MKAAGRSRAANWRKAVALAVIAVAVVAGAWALHVRGERIASDDATIDAEVVHVASTVSGRIVRIAVQENSSVRTGDLLFQIDPVPLQLVVNQAEAELALARASLDRERRGVNTQRSTATLAAEQTNKARANLALAQRTTQRLQPLEVKGYVPTQQLDQARTVERDAVTSLRQAQEQERATQQAVGNDDSASAAVRAREAALALARHALESATVRAPHDGRVVGLSVTSGEIVAPSQALFTLVVSSEWFAIANLRESQLARIEVGDCATVYSMIDRRQAMRGKVQGIGSGVLDADRINLPRSVPYVQKSLNWVRVAQRFPVRIQLEEPPPSLTRLGASAVVEIAHGEHCR